MPDPKFLPLNLRPASALGVGTGRAIPPPPVRPTASEAFLADAGHQAPEGTSEAPPPTYKDEFGLPMELTPEPATPTPPARVSRIYVGEELKHVDAILRNVVSRIREKRPDLASRVAIFETDPRGTHLKAAPLGLEPIYLNTPGGARIVDSLDGLEAQGVSRESIEFCKAANFQVKLDDLPQIWPDLTNWVKGMHTLLPFLVPILAAEGGSTFEAGSESGAVLLPASVAGIPMIGSEPRPELRQLTMTAIKGARSVLEGRTDTEKAFGFKMQQEYLRLRQQHEPGFKASFGMFQSDSHNTQVTGQQWVDHAKLHANTYNTLLLLSNPLTPIFRDVDLQNAVLSFWTLGRGNRAGEKGALNLFDARNYKSIVTDPGPVNGKRAVPLDPKNPPRGNLNWTADYLLCGSDKVKIDVPVALHDLTLFRCRSLDGKHEVILAQNPKMTIERIRDAYENSKFLLITTGFTGGGISEGRGAPPRLDSLKMHRVSGFAREGDVILDMGHGTDRASAEYLAMTYRKKSADRVMDGNQLLGNVAEVLDQIEHNVVSLS